MSTFKWFLRLLLFIGHVIFIPTYIYIVIHRRICFVLSELFSVARQARFTKLGSKPGWLKCQSKILPLSHEETSASEGNLNAYVSQLFLFNGYRELDSYEEPCIMLMATHSLPLLESSTLQGYGCIYIYSHPQTDLFRSVRTLQLYIYIYIFLPPKVWVEKTVQSVETLTLQ